MHLRQKALANGNFHLYLDKYWKGKRSYEYLQLYLVRKITECDKEQNLSTWLIAEGIKAERLLKAMPAIIDSKQSESAERFVGGEKELRASLNKLLFPKTIGRSTLYNCLENFKSERCYKHK
ncbi:MAG: hypothetical protein WDO14_24215 [Bacteroidota bacterium]